ncbi:MFS transporter [Stutzerimonas stutzeri]|uniref:Arabinose efflux permease family protein n=1 Tax=Stutzerimonas stutzeri RCH2 TaxID=644801 RepID=L0GNL9_STUST|nr:MFS transporter [Stutzerimonas stutzeri]AGA87397.1 arabinose efflux permease family protein [Stutzerimonas stutzeri RCH2]
MKSSLRWLVLGILSSALLLIVIDMTVIYLALPSLTYELRASATEKLWIVNAYALTVAGLLPGMGALGDRFGHKRMFISGLVVFGWASLGAAFSPTPEILIAARVALAVGAAMMMPATLAIIRHVFEDTRERALAFGIWAAIASGGAAFGPVVGGVLLEHFWWGSVFIINVPIVLLALVLAVIWVPSRPGNPQRPFDLLASLWVMGALVGLTLAIKEAGKADPSLLQASVAACTAVVCALAFLRRQRQTAVPMIDFTLFRDRSFSAGVITASVASAALMGMELVVSQRLQLVVGLSPLQAGLTILPIPLGAFIVGPLAGLALPRIGAERILSTSLALSAAGALLYLLGYAGEQWLQILSFSLLGFGVGAAMTAASSAMLLQAPADRAGMAASIEEVSYELGGALGIAILGSLMSAVYAAAIVTPGTMALPDLALDSLDGALIAAEALPEAIAAPLISLAKGAFDNAFAAVMIAVVALLGFTSVGIAMCTRKTR